VFMHTPNGSMGLRVCDNIVVPVIKIEYAMQFPTKTAFWVIIVQEVPLFIQDSVPGVHELSKPFSSLLG
jgi:hypothetical protein